jgi:hypothetical protein
MAPMLRLLGVLPLATVGRSDYYRLPSHRLKNGERM